MIGILNLYIIFPGCKSLKEKRSYIKPLQNRIHREFNVSVAEMDLQDKWSETMLSLVMVGNDKAHLERSLDTILKWVESQYPVGQVYDNKIEFII